MIRMLFVDDEAIVLDHFAPPAPPAASASGRSSSRPIADAAASSRAEVADVRGLGRSECRHGRHKLPGACARIVSPGAARIVPQ